MRAIIITHLWFVRVAYQKGPKEAKIQSKLHALDKRNASAAAEVRTAQEELPPHSEAQQLFPSGCLLLLTFDFYAIQATNYRYVIEALRQSFPLSIKRTLLTVLVVLTCQKTERGIYFAIHALQKSCGRCSSNEQQTAPSLVKHVALA